MVYRGSSLFQNRLLEACKQRGTSPAELARSIGIPARAAIALRHGSLRSIDSYRLFQIADRLRVSTDWLLGRSSERYLSKPEMPNMLDSVLSGFSTKRIP
jgi:transcriptional regulator with XRE-family HTH domain